MNPIRLLPLLLLTACAAAPNIPTEQVFQAHHASPEAILNDTVSSPAEPDAEAILNDAETPLISVNRPNQFAITSLTDYAKSLLGTRYKYGGTSPDTGFDCSGYVGHVFKKTRGLVLPRSSLSIANQGRVLTLQQLEIGDLVFFNTRRKKFSHVGIYLGKQTFIHSPSHGGGVRIENLAEDYWRKHYNGARRISE